MKLKRRLASNEFHIVVAANASSGQEFTTIVTLEDSVAEGNETILFTGTSDSGEPVEGATLTIVDDDFAGLALSKSSITLPEASGQTTYTVKLQSEPTAEVTVAVSSADDTVATVSPSSLRFTASNWSRAQTVTATAVDDDVDSADRSTTITNSASGGGYSNISETVSVLVTDDDTAGLRLSRTTVTVAEPSGIANYTVKFQSEPTAAVSVALSSADDTVATVSPLNLTFTAGNWSRAQTVTVTVVDDFFELERSTEIANSASGGGQ